MLFLLSIIRLDENIVIRKIFINSVDSFLSNSEQCRVNTYRSPVYDICVTCENFGILNTMTSIISGSIPIPSKKKWSELIWRKGWELDDNYWRAINTMNKENDLLSSTMSGSRYMVWWQLSDIATDMIKVCECIALVSY